MPGIGLGSSLGFGDVNGDGYDDAVAGAQYKDGLQGEAYLFLGSASGLVTPPAQVLSATAPAPAYFGGSLAVDDFDADGFADAVIATTLHSEITVYSGSAAGLVTPPDVVGESDSYFGSEVRAAGDLNGDGARDLLANGWQNAWVYFGEKVPDNDGDGFFGADDCDDTDGAVFPGAPEGPGDEVDQDCDGAELCLVDADGDGVRLDEVSVVASADGDCTDDGEASSDAPAGDCDDTDPGRFPGAMEIAGDGIDQDCDSADLPGAQPPQDQPSGAQEPAASGGCGCSTGAPRSPVLYLLALALAGRRRGARG